MAVSECKLENKYCTVQKFDGFKSGGRSSFSWFALKKLKIPISGYPTLKCYVTSKHPCATGWEALCYVIRNKNMIALLVTNIRLSFFTISFFLSNRVFFYFLIAVM